MKKETNLTSLHCIFFIYQSFAYATDGKIADQEKQVIARFMYRWTGQEKNHLNQIIKETLTWSQQNIKTKEDQIGTMLSMLGYLKEQPQFNTVQREYFLMDIRNIARSDGQFLDQQKKWHDMLANILGLDIRISQSTTDDISGAVKKVERRKIGFRR